MNTVDPTSRVNAFIEDFYDEWRMVDGAPRWDAWRSSVALLDKRHFAPGTGCREENAFSSRPNHAPDRERIERVLAAGQRVRVETSRKDILTYHYEYELENIGGDWKICSLMHFFDAPGVPLIPQDDHARLRAQATWDAPFLAMEGEPPRGDALFVDGATLMLQDGEQVPVEVQHVGELDVVSGAICVRDLGYGAHRLSPLARRAPRGRHRVEAAVAVGRVVAVRVVFEPVLDAAHAARRNSALDAVVSLLSGQVVQEDVMDPTTGIRLLSKGVVLDRAGIEALTLVRLDALRLEDLDLEFRLWGLLDDYRAGMNQAALAAGEVASWHPAVTGRGSYLVSVDAANVGICELDSLLSLEARELDRLYQRHVAGGERPVMTSLQMARQCDGIAVESGWGDGSYPVYWGVDAYGAPVRLVVEFL